MGKYENYVKTLKRKIKVFDNKEIALVCIGNKKVLWDCLGPMVGTYLENKLDKHMIIGNMNSNICKKEDLVYYKSLIKNKYIIAVDAAIGDCSLEGEVFVDNKPIVMGLSLNTTKGKIGDLGVKICVTENLNKNQLIKLTKFVGSGIEEVLNKTKKYC